MIKILSRLTFSAIFMASCISSSDAQAHHPYAQGMWSMSAHFAYAPSSFNEDLNFTTALADARTGPVKIPSGFSDATGTNLIKRTAKYKFSDHYQAPLRYGFDIGYFFRTGTELFLGLDYYQMRGKSFTLFNETLNGNNVAIKGKVKPHNRIAFFGGVRHFFDMNSWYSPYLGFKVGVVLHTKRSTDGREDLNYTILNGNRIDGKTSFMLAGARSIAGLYGGIHAGVDVPLTALDPCLHNFSLFFAAEAAGHGAIEYDLPVSRINTTNGGFQLTHEVTKAPRTFMSYPLTVGIKARF